MSVSIRNERENEYFYVETMIRSSFWNVYKPGCDEHVMAHKLRNAKEFLPELDFVAECDGIVVGNIMCSRAKIVNEQNVVIDDKNIVVVGPIGVLPEWQNKGVGSMLMEHVKREARLLGYKGVVLYGNPNYYHRFGFVDAKEYSITMPNGTNMDAFMIFELEPHSLDGIHGRCYECDAFEVSSEEIVQYERKFTGKNSDKDKECSKLDCSILKQEFTNAGVDFPLKEEECNGLSKVEQNEINPCGTYCGNCDDYGVVCDGCRNRKGKPIWYELYSMKEPCAYYVCVEKHQYHDCSQCQQVPCNKYFDYPDPNMSDELKQMWFKLRMENFNQINCLKQIDMKDTYEENVKQYRR